MSGLTEQDREELLANIVDDPMWIDDLGQPLGYHPEREVRIGEHLDRQCTTVEQILTRHVEAFRASLVTYIEAAVDAYVTTAGLPTFIPTNTADAERTGRLVGLSAAARIVADHPIGDPA